MPAPDSYTDDTIASYMQQQLGAIAETLGWTMEAGDFEEAVNETLLAYGADDIADATDIRKLRAIARYQAWKQAVGSLSAYYNFQSDQERFDRSQMLAGAKSALALAEADCVPYGVGGQVAYIMPVRRTQDPYGVDPYGLFTDANA